MHLTYEEDEASKRITVVTLFAEDGVEEIFLTELFRVFCKPNKDDEITVTRQNGIDAMIWRPEDREWQE